jgi:FlaA1/EpsC-like NDP-sugar epimerase
MKVAWRLRSYRFVLKVAYDVLAWTAATVAATTLRYTHPTDAPWRHALLVAMLLSAVYLLAGLVVRLHQGRARTGSLDEILLVTGVAAASGTAVFVANLGDRLIARTVPAGATVCFILLAGFGRAVWRAGVESRRVLGVTSSEVQRALVIGAGDAGRDLILSMLRDPAGRWLPVGLLDDDRNKRHLRIRGVPVLGDTSMIDEVVQSTDAQIMVVAIPSARAEDIARIAESGRRSGVDVKVLPSTAELLREHVGIRDIRDINLADVLGRRQVDTDVASIAGYLTGRRVLVTGAGGSIGSELCRQIAGFGPSELIMLDRDESALHAVQLSLTGRALLDSPDVVLCDIRDRQALRQVMLARRPHVVFHAAALKHLPMLEQYPAEAVKTNVRGTLHVLQAAAAADVERLVNISTDKAANPSSVLGYSKRLAERVTATYARLTGRAYLSVRFGNVLGSRGSVLTAFAEQIARGGPVTVTDPNVTRYFMTIEEACQLVVQAGVIGRPGEALVLDMGTPIKIVDVARHLIRLQQQPISIEYTGLREGEKLHEDLFGASEPRDERPWHHLISHVPVAEIDLEHIEDLRMVGSRAEVQDALVNACEADDSWGHPARQGAAVGETVSRRDWRD